MNLNLGRNSYASYYNNQSSTSGEHPSSLLKMTTSKLSQLYTGIRNPDEIPTLVHPIWPAPKKSQPPSSVNVTSKAVDSLSVPMQPKLPPNLIEASSQPGVQQEKNPMKKQGSVLGFMNICSLKRGGKIFLATP